MEKRKLSFWQIWNMSFGFLGIQMGFALQNSNVSRIFQTLGANIDDIPILWVAAPMTGLIIQPIIGYFQTGLGIRDEENLTFSRRYFSFGSIIYNAHLPFCGLRLLWIMDAPSMFRWNHFVLLLAIIFRKTTYHGICHAKFFYGLALTSHQNYR
jgi:maltose/moltooligosaccharide transporter